MWRYLALPLREASKTTTAVMTMSTRTSLGLSNKPNTSFSMQYHCPSRTGRCIDCPLATPIEPQSPLDIQHFRIPP